MRLAVVGIIAGGTALSGCAQLAGIDVTSGVDHSNVTLGFERVSIGATVATGPQDLTPDMATYLVDSDTDPTGFLRVPAMLATGDTSTWTAKIADGEPQALFTLPDQSLNLYDLGRDVLGDLDAFEHPGATPGDDATVVASTLTIPAWNGTDVFQLYIVGTWAQRALPAPALAGDLMLSSSDMYGSFAPAAGAKPLAIVTDADAVLALAHTPSGKLVGAYDQTGLASGMVAGTIAPVTADSTAMAAIDATAVGTRFAAATPAGGTPSISWSVTAAPGSKVGVATGPLLDAGVVATADTMIASTFGNPFATTRMWPAVLSVTATSSRTFMFDAGGAMPLAVPLANTLAEVTPAATADAALAAPMATAITLAGTALATDGVVVAVDPTKPVMLGFSTETGPAPALYAVTIVELVPNADGSLVDSVPVLTALSLAPAFRLPPEKLGVGHTYVLHVTTIVGGYPTASVGDLQERSLPMSSAMVTPGAFTVGAP